MIVPQDNLEPEELLQLYDSFIDKLKNTVYKLQLDSWGDVLQNKREIFAGLNIEDKCILLSEILHLFQCISINANLKLLGETSKAGELRIGKNITKYKQISIIHQSPAGIYEQEIDLNRL